MEQQVSHNTGSLTSRSSSSGSLAKTVLSTEACSISSISAAHVGDAADVLLVRCSSKLTHFFWTESACRSTCDVFFWMHEDALRLGASMRSHCTLTSVRAEKDRKARCVRLVVTSRLGSSCKAVHPVVSGVPRMHAVFCWCAILQVLQDLHAIALHALCTAAHLSIDEALIELQPAQRRTRQQP